MKNKEDIINLLLTKFDYVYCDTCYYNHINSTRCDDCHRKYMQWSLDETIAEQLADEILKL